MGVSVDGVMADRPWGDIWPESLARELGVVKHEL
jgi:hypothetical protein